MPSTRRRQLQARHQSVGYLASELARRAPRLVWPGVASEKNAFWIGCAGGAVSAVVVHLSFLFAAGGAEPGAAVTKRESVVEGGGAPLPVADAGGQDLLRRLAADVADLRDRVASLPSRAEPMRTNGTAPAPMVDEATLVAALQRVRQLEEETRFASLSDTELYSQAERQMRADKMDRLSCRRMLQVLLARPISSGLRASAAMLLAQVQRDLGDLPAAAAALQRVVDEFGFASDEGARAGNRLALLATDTKDWAAGIAIAEQVAREGPVAEAFEARWGAAFLRRMAGDLAGARAALAQLIADCKDRPEVEHVARMSERQLEEMQGR